MICRTCLRRASALRTGTQQTLRRPFSAVAPRWNAAATTAPSKPSSPSAGSPPPLTDPLKAADEAAPAKKALSSCPAGTVLTGLNYFNNKADPVAKPDEDYPAWLWTCLDKPVEAAEATQDDAGDEFSKSKKQRRAAAKKRRQLEAELLASGNLEALAPKVPLQQQSINLPGGDEAGGVEAAVHAAEKRDELRRAMTNERKGKIKEANYLRSM